MPYARRKFYKRKSTRKYSSKPRARARPRARTYRRKYASPRVGVVPTTSVVRMRYVDQITINPAIDSIATYSFRSNSIYDPNYTGTGHQPLGHDQAELLYENYTVVGSKITAKYMIESTADGSVPTIVGIYTDFDSTPPGDLQNLLEQGRSRNKMITGHGTSGNNSAIITHKFSSKRHFGYKDLKDVQNEVGATFGGNPARQSYFVLFAAPMENNLNDVPPVTVLVTIDYIVRLTEPKDLSSS